LNVRFAATHSGPLLRWHAVAIQRLLELPDTILVERRERNATRGSRTLQSLLGFRARGSMIDESGVNASPIVTSAEGLPDFCLAFDARAASEAPRSRLGTWFFDFDGAESAPGLNAFCERRDVVEARLLQIDGTGRIATLRTGVVGVDRFSLGRTVNELLDEVSAWPAAAARDIETGVANPSTASPPTTPREPSPGRSLVAILGHWSRRAIAIVEKRFFTYSWNIGVVKATPAQIARSSSLPEVRWCEAGNRRFFADPFGAVIDGLPTAFAEEIDPTTSRGSIVRFIVVDDELMPVERVLDESYHVSYPYVFEHEHVWYAIPESCQNGEVALYRLASAGREWRKHAVLLPGLRAVDSSVFMHAGKFWLLCGIFGDGPNQRLHAYYADALTGPWQPHPRNPVKIDIRSARPAGPPFMLDGALHRPAQDCTRKYGRRISIVRMNTIDEFRYDEETVGVIEPPPGTYRRGVHTLSAMGDSTLIDGLRRDFSPRAAVWRTIRTIRRLFAGRTSSQSEPAATGRAVDGR
jgi:hypothetical protein